MCANLQKYHNYDQLAKRNIIALIVHSTHSAKNTALRMTSHDFSVSLGPIPFHQDNYSFQFNANFRNFSESSNNNKMLLEQIFCPLAQS